MTSKLISPPPENTNRIERQLNADISPVIELAAADAAAEARAQALSEILERYVKFKVIAEGLCLPDVRAGCSGRRSRQIGKALQWFLDELGKKSEIDALTAGL